MMANGPDTIRAFLAAERDAQTRFLAELVKVPSDNPPGDCQAHVEAGAGCALGEELLEDLLGADRVLAQVDEGDALTGTTPGLTLLVGT